MIIKTALNLILLLTFSTSYAGQYGVDIGDPITDMNRQNQINQLQFNQQIQADQQTRQLQEYQNRNYQLEKDLQREKVLRSGQGRTNSLADEIYR